MPGGGCQGFDLIPALPGQAFSHINALTRLARLPSLFMNMLILVVIVDIRRQVLEMVKTDLGPRTQILGKLYFLQTNIPQPSYARQFSLFRNSSAALFSSAH
jgi:hypothetical protein